MSRLLQILKSVVLIIALLFLAHFSSLHAQTPTLLITQMIISSGKVNKTLTIAVPENSTGTTVVLCNVPIGKVTVMLPESSSFAISNVGLVYANGTTVNPVVRQYDLRKVVLNITDSTICLKITIGKSPVEGCFVPVLGMYSSFVTNNGTLTISSSQFPEMMLIGHEIAHLLAYRVCVLSVAPIRVSAMPQNFTLVVYRGPMTVVMGSQVFTLYAVCYVTYNRKFMLKIGGTAEVRVWAYYAIPRPCTGTVHEVLVRLSRTLVSTCRNVYICNSTTCGNIVSVSLHRPVYVSLGSLIVTRYIIDSVFTRTVTLPSPPVIPLGSVLFVDEKGTTLTLRDLEKIDLTLSGPITVKAGPNVCIVAGNYKILYKIGNATERLGPVYIQEGAKVKLPIIVFRTHIVKEGLCKLRNCTPVLYICDKRIIVNNNTHVIISTRCDLSNIRAFVKLGEAEIPVGVTLSDGSLRIFACARPVVFNVRDYIGPISTRIVIDHAVQCISGRECLVPCGLHTVTLDLGYGKVSYILNVVPGTSTLDVTYVVVSQRIVELTFLTVSLAILAICLSLVRRSLRKRERRASREESEDIIEIE